MKQTLKRCAQNLSLSVISYPLTLCKPICTTSSHAKHYFLVSFFKAQGNLLYAGEKSVCCLEIFLRKIGFFNFCYTTDKFRLITTEQSSSTATLPNSEIHVCSELCIACCSFAMTARKHGNIQRVISAFLSNNPWTPTAYTLPTH